MLATIASLVFL
jgi:hypothetical protein